MNMFQIFIILLLVAAANFALSGFEGGFFNACNDPDYRIMNTECFVDSVDDLDRGE